MVDKWDPYPHFDISMLSNSTKSVVLSKHDMMGHSLLLKPDNLHREVVLNFCDRVYWLEADGR
jgi:hypothetical protein